MTKTFNFDAFLSNFLKKEPSRFLVFGSCKSYYFKEGGECKIMQMNCEKVEQARLQREIKFVRKLAFKGANNDLFRKKR